MVTTQLVPPDIVDLYEVHEWRNATGILATSNPKVAIRFETPLVNGGWVEKQFVTGIEVDGVSTPSPTHKVDCFKNRVALEVEWNAKDAFYDRDLNNFRLLFDLRIIDVGVIVTRATHLQAIFKQLGKGKSYGNSTTHMSKLLPKLDGGSGGGCPVLVFGITRKLYVEDEISPELLGSDDDEDGEPDES